MNGEYNISRKDVIQISKIKLSYVDQEELQEVVKLLGPMLRNVKVAKNDQGKYKKAYMDLHPKKP